jgi:hypothetical protein
MSEKNKNNKILFYVSLFLFLGAGAFLYLAVNEKNTLILKKPAELLHPVNSDHVNYNLKTALQQQQLDQINTLEEIRRGKIDPDASKMFKPHESSISFESDNINNDVLEALGKNKNNEATSLSPDDIVQAHLYEVQVMKQMDEAYRKEYAKKFIAYAKSKGFAVKLDAQLRIVAIRKIPIERLPSTNVLGLPATRQ